MFLGCFDMIRHSWIMNIKSRWVIGVKARFYDFFASCCNVQEKSAWSSLRSGASFWVFQRVGSADPILVGNLWRNICEYSPKYLIISSFRSKVLFCTDHMRCFFNIISYDFKNQMASFEWLGHDLAADVVVEPSGKGGFSVNGSSHLHFLKPT